MKSKNVFVGKNDCSSMPNGKITESFKTLKEAEKFLEDMRLQDKVSVENGEYYIDTPEDMVI